MQNPKSIDSIEANLLDRWNNLWAPIKAPEDGKDLLTAWSMPERKYHNLQHLTEGLRLFDRHVKGKTELDWAIEVAFWFHDSIHTIPDSEHLNVCKSAAWAWRVCYDHAYGMANPIHDAVMDTEHDPKLPPKTMLGKFVCDIDLSILAASWIRFSEYEEQIRAEYSFVEDSVFYRERGKILRRFLQAPIYKTQTFASFYEGHARTNILRTLSLQRYSMGSNEPHTPMGERIPILCG